MPRIIKTVNDFQVEVDNDDVTSLNGRYNVQLSEYDIQCESKDSQLVAKQKDCYLTKRGVDEAHGGKLIVAAGNKKCVFITRDHFLYEIDVETKAIKKM